MIEQIATIEIESVLYRLGIRSRKMAQRHNTENSFWFSIYFELRNYYQFGLINGNTSIFRVISGCDEAVIASRSFVVTMYILNIGIPIGFRKGGKTVHSPLSDVIKNVS